MPIRRLPDREGDKICRHPEHRVPTMISLPNGTYEHTCPGCGKKTIFRVNNPTLRAPLDVREAAKWDFRCFGYSTRVPR